VTTLLLVRHAAHDWLGRGIPGRLPGVTLNGEGQLQARDLSLRIAARVDAIYSSPQERARETAAPLAERLELPVVIAPEFDEIDFGEWTGWTFERLRAQGERWREWVEHKSVASAPGGESLAAVARRTTAGAERLARLHPDQWVLVVSHGDVIKALVAACLGLSLDGLERFDVAPASLTVLARAGDGWRLLCLNASPTGPSPLH
jgi:broad specificity phosphatase PhoE